MWMVGTRSYIPLQGYGSFAALQVVREIFLYIYICASSVKKKNKGQQAAARQKAIRSRPPTSDARSVSCSSKKRHVLILAQCLF